MLNFLHIWNGMVKGFKKCIIYHFLDNFFCKHFYYIIGFCKKKFNFCKFANFFADSKSRAQELSNDVSFVLFVFWFSITPAGIGLRKTKSVQISFDGLFANIFKKFLCKTLVIRFLMSKAFQKAKSYQNLTTESGSKQRFSLLQEKAIIQAVCLRTQEVSIKARL